MLIKRLKPRFLLCICLLAASLCGGGAVQATPTSTLRFERIDPAGLEDFSINALLQDRQGYIWIGTNTTGLYRYNGYQAIRYANQPHAQNSMPHDRVAAMLEDAQGRLWVGTQDGLARFNPATNDFTRFAPASGPYNNRIIKALAADRSGGIWLGTWGGLQHFDPKSGNFVQFVHDAADPDSIAANDLNAIALDAQGGVYAGTWPGGLDYLAAGARSFRHLRLDDPAKPDPKLNIVRSLYFMAATSQLWIGTERGVVLWDTRRPWESRQRLHSPDSRVTSFSADQDGGLWAGTLSAGLLHWAAGSQNTETFTHRPIDTNSLQSNHIGALLQDRGGMLWVGSFTDGISLVNLNTQGFQRYVPFDPSPQEPYPNNALAYIEGAPGNRLWLGQNTGLSLFDPASGEVLKHWRGGQNGLAHDIVYALYQQPEGPLWVGTSAGLNRLDAGGSMRTLHFGSLQEDYINIIAPGSKGALWLGTGAAVLRFEPDTGRISRYAHDPNDPNSRSVNGSTTIVEDRDGRVWMGSDWNGGGLDLLMPASGKITHFRHKSGDPDSLADDNVSAIYQDRFGRLWIGTGKGLNEVLTDSGGQVRLRGFGQAGSVGEVKIQAIRSDKAGMLWLSTARGLLRLEPDTGKVSRYDTLDGLSEGFAVGVAQAATDGRLYFGGVRGLTGITPAAVRTRALAPLVAISDVNIFNHLLRETGPRPGLQIDGTRVAPSAVTAAYEQGVVSFDFAAMDYADPEHNRFSYRLTGFDRGWVDTDGRHRSATYTNLAPGEYVFEVKAQNARGQWSEQAAQIRLTILPPWWQTWWCRLLMVLLVLGALTLAYQWRVRRLTRQRQQLERLVAERTRELEESNRKLATLSTTDALTGIGNRRGFDLTLASEWRRAKRAGNLVALAMFDVDHFKAYNDHYGHQAGDECLRQIALLIASYARRTSDLVARYGGEEFAFLAAGSDAEHLRVVVEEIQSELAKLALPHVRAPLGYITLSVGVAALGPRAGQRIEHLIEQADTALYRAKQDGRNRVVVASAEVLTSPSSGT